MNKQCSNCNGIRETWINEKSGFMLCKSCGLVAREPMPIKEDLIRLYQNTIPLKI